MASAAKKKEERVQRVLATMGPRVYAEDDSGERYESFTLSTGETYRVHDTVRLRPPHPTADMPYYVCEIDSIQLGTQDTPLAGSDNDDSDGGSDSEDDGEPEVDIRTQDGMWVFFTARWFYQGGDLSEVTSFPAKKMSNREIFWSFHTDLNPAEAIEGRVEVRYCWTDPEADAALREASRTRYVHACRFIYDNQSLRMHRLSVHPRNVPEKEDRRDVVKMARRLFAAHHDYDEREEWFEPGDVLKVIAASKRRPPAEHKAPQRETAAARAKPKQLASPPAAAAHKRPREEIEDWLLSMPSAKKSAAASGPVQAAAAEASEAPQAATAAAEARAPPAAPRKLVMPTIPLSDTIKQLMPAWYALCTRGECVPVDTAALAVRKQVMCKDMPKLACLKGNRCHYLHLSPYDLVSKYGSSKPSQPAPSSAFEFKSIVLKRSDIEYIADKPDRWETARGFMVRVFVGTRYYAATPVYRLAEVQGLVKESAGARATLVVVGLGKSPDLQRVVSVQDIHDGVATSHEIGLYLQQCKQLKTSPLGASHRTEDVLHRKKALLQGL
eukprot:m51a1_g9690 hypothetical protein (555) ;mRNA; r:1337082-1339469